MTDKTPQGTEWQDGSPDREGWWWVTEHGVMPSMSEARAVRVWRSAQGALCFLVVDGYRTGTVAIDWPRNWRCAPVLTAADAERAALQRARVEALEAAAREALDVLRLCDPDGNRARAINAPEDATVGALCERIGYGATMDAAARLWRLKPVERGGGGGAFTCGPCVGTLKRTVAMLAAALEIAPVLTADELDEADDAPR